MPSGQSLWPLAPVEKGKTGIFLRSERRRFRRKGEGRELPGIRSPGHSPLRGSAASSWLSDARAPSVRASLPGGENPAPRGEEEGWGWFLGSRSQITPSYCGERGSASGEAGSAIRRGCPGPAEGPERDHQLTAENGARRQGKARPEPADTGGEN